MEDLPDKVSKKDFGGMSEILEAINKYQTPEQIEKFYEKYVSKIQKGAEKESNGTIIENPKKYARENIMYCFENLEIDDKELVMGRWRGVIPGLGED